MVRKTREELQAEARERLAGHELQVVQEAGQVLAWYLQRPGKGRAGSQLIIAHPEGVTITGDWAPNHGCEARKPLSWFVGDGMSPDYLGEKFLPKVWCPDRAESWLQELLERSEPPDDGAPADLELRETARSAIRAALEGGTFGTEAEYTNTIGDVLYLDEGLDAEMAFPGRDHDAWHQALLHAIQRRFSECFWRRYARFHDGQPVTKASEAIRAVLSDKGAMTVGQVVDLAKSPDLQAADLVSSFRQMCHAGELTSRRYVTGPDLDEEVVLFWLRPSCTPDAPGYPRRSHAATPNAGSRSNRS